MARSRGRTRRNRDDEEDLPEALPLDDSEQGRRSRGADRPMREPKGFGFALPVAFGAGSLAALLAFIAVLLVGQLSGGDAGAATDAGGISAARLLSARDLDSWRKGFGTMGQVFEVLDAELRKRRAEVESAGDTRELTLFDEAVEDWKNGTFKTDSPYVPGFYKIFGKADEAGIQDAVVESARKRGILAAVTLGDGTLMGAVLRDRAGQNVIVTGEPYLPNTSPTRQVGDTKVYAQRGKTGPIRIYEHPILDRNGNLAGNAVVTIDATAAQSTNIAGVAAAGAAASFLGAFLVVLILCMRPVKALRKLAVESDAIARGELGTHVSTRGPKLVALVARNVQRIAVLAAEGGGGAPQVVHQQVEVVPTAQIAHGLAPASLPRTDALEIEATFKQSPNAGNDYHDAIQVDEQHYGFFIADIPLQGVPGALYMAQIRALFRDEAVGEPHPADVLKAMNRAFARDLPRGVYVTASYAVVNVESGICRVASAQHLPLVFWKREKKASAKVACEGIALGLDQGPVFDKTIQEKAVQLDPGDRIVLYTDGAINAKNRNGASYGAEKFYYVVNREAPKNSAAFVNFVANDMDLFHEGAPQVDDFTIFTVRRMK